MAPNKRKRDILDFDPNKSDSEDESFSPGAGRPTRSRKRSRPVKGKKTAARKKPRYRGSDIEDEDEDLSESDQEESFAEDDGEDEEEEAPVNETTGRRMRKAAVKRGNYKESSDDDDDAARGSNGKDELVGKSPKKPPTKSKIVLLKVPRDLGADSMPLPRRSTRARTAEAEGDADMVELSNSGNHALPARGSKSRSPEGFGRRGGKTTRGGKGLRKAPPPVIEELSQEDSAMTEQPAEQGASADVEATETHGDEGDEVDTADAHGEDEPMETVEANEDGDNDDDDDVPIGRRTRGGRAAVADTGADEGAAEEKDTGTRRRLTRKSRANNKSLQEPSSDFEPGNESEDENESASDHNGDNVGDDDEYSSPSARGRKSSRPKGRRSARGSRRAESQEEEEIAQEELEDLVVGSRTRRQRRSPEPIIYHQKERRRTKEVNYAIPALNSANLEPEEEEEPAPTPSNGRRGRANPRGLWDKSLHTAAGPFGGVVGDGSLFSGPWGNGAVENIESDSSDDEMGARSGVAGQSAMASGSAAPQGAQGLLGQSNVDGVGGGMAAQGPNVGKMKNHKALADADPLGVDLNVDFNSVGGMEGHIDQLKEMVQLPLLYPELFSRLKVTPPRGVLFHGPPGTGKTLLARALANSVGVGGRKITFYMRKGADALSKWVGEAEKQLRLLFEEARKTQPSIIFFDEIDGLAPVRSSKQEQIHASIVSTLLALMDGMDGRGQVIVIGATNRPDNIDPALRRPGRFDREFFFPLPDVDARKSILDIHTKDWGLSDDFKKALAKEAKGYGGADLRALCTEAALNAIQRTYPQIYFSKDKLVVDPDKVIVQMTDFTIAKRKIIPSSERSSVTGAAPLPKAVEPLLRDQFRTITTVLDNTLPRNAKLTALEEAMFESHSDGDFGYGREALQQEFERSRVFRPRLLICGFSGMGQSYISAAILHYFEGVHVQNFDLPTILGDTRPAEQVLVGLFTEVKRQQPSVIFIPNVDTWYPTLVGPALTAFLTMLRSIQPTDPILVLGTAETEAKDMDAELKRDLFGFSSRNLIEIARPVKENRQEYFAAIISHIKRLPKDFPNPAGRKKRVLEELPLAPPPPSRKMTKEELHAEQVRYRQLLNHLKVHLQPVMDQISKKYRKFRQPVIPATQYQYLFDEANPNFVRPDVADTPPRPYEIDTDSEGRQGLRATDTNLFFYNLEVGTMEERLANGYYISPYEFLKDVEALKRDAKAIGDRERYLKASELMTNVEVDVLDIANKLKSQGLHWDELYALSQRRKADRDEKVRKKKALQPVVNLVQSDVGNAETSGEGSQVGTGAAKVHTTTAHFQVIGAQPNGTGDTSQSHAATNGTSVPSHAAEEDVQMTDVDSQSLAGPTSPMQPPSQWPRMEARSLNTSTRATTGGTTQISQVSAVQSIPPGVSPSALLNDASTTKTSDPSNRSSNGSTQATNGVHHGQSSPLENIPDTQPYPGASQTTSSDEQWPHSQAHGLMRGYIQQPKLSQGSQSQASPVGAKSSHAPSMANLLNDPSPDEPSQSQRQSQQVELDESSAEFFLDELTKRTSGCTIEQLEQITRELMSEIWRTRGEHNRMKVFNSVTRVFNEAINDIEMMQRLLQPSQIDA